MFHQTYVFFPLFVLIRRHCSEAEGKLLPQPFNGGIASGMMGERCGLLASDQLTQPFHCLRNEFGHHFDLSRCRSIPSTPLQPHVRSA